MAPPKLEADSAPSAHNIRAAAYTASTGSYGLGGFSPPAGTGSAYWAKVGGSNCMGPSAPAEFAPDVTPGREDVPFSDSTVPMAASTVQGRPGHVAAALAYSDSMAAGTDPIAAAVPVPGGPPIAIGPPVVSD